MKFNLTRFINLIKRDFITHKKSILYICLGVWGLLAVIVGFNAFTHTSKGYQYGHFWFPIILIFLFIGCLTFTTLVFREFRTPAGRLQFLALPASNFEKVLSRWLYSLVLMPGFVVGSIYLFASFFLADGQTIDREFGREGISYFPIAFVLLHAATFLLTLFFNKLVPFKVLVTSTIINLITAFILFILFQIIFFSIFSRGIWNGPTNNLTMTSEGQDFFEYSLLPILKFVLLFLLAPYLWIVSYFKMKEKEA